MICHKTKTNQTNLPLGVDKRVHTFSKSMNPKVNGIAKLKFELVYNDVAVQHIYYAVRGPPPLYFVVTIHVLVFIYITSKSAENIETKAIPLSFPLVEAHPTLLVGLRICCLYFLESGVLGITLKCIWW